MQTARLEEQTQRKTESQLISTPLFKSRCISSLSRNGALSQTRALHSIDRNGDLTKTRKLHSTNYLSAGVSAAERPIVTTE